MIKIRPDCYSFGSAMPGRAFSSNSYRYGFNNQEKDHEISGDDNDYNFQFRLYDSRMGKFFSVDPEFGKYTWNSVYAFAENRVIDGIDIEGREFGSAIFFGFGIRAWGWNLSELNTQFGFRMETPRVPIPNPQNPQLNNGIRLVGEVMFGYFKKGHYSSIKLENVKAGLVFQTVPEQTPGPSQINPAAGQSYSAVISVDTKVRSDYEMQQIRDGVQDRKTAPNSVFGTQSAKLEVNIESNLPGVTKPSNATGVVGGVVVNNLFNKKPMQFALRGGASYGTLMGGGAQGTGLNQFVDFIYFKPTLTVDINLSNQDDGDGVPAIGQTSMFPLFAKKPI